MWWYGMLQMLEMRYEDKRKERTRLDVVNRVGGGK